MFCKFEQGEDFSMATNKSTYRPPKTEEQRQARLKYQREYRRANPRRVQQWQENYIVRAAARLAERAERAGSAGGVDRGD